MPRLKRPGVLLFLLMLALARPAVATAQPATPPGFEVYTLGLLSRGSAAEGASDKAADLSKAHLANLEAMWREGLLVASGPVLVTGSGTLRGVVVFRGADRAAIARRLESDPLVKAGRLTVTLKPWMGPENIGDEYRARAAANPGVPDKMVAYQLVLLRPVPTAAPMTAGEQLAHLQHMDAMVKAGHLMVAGPILEPGDLAGVFVFGTDAARAAELAAGDPAVTAKKMTVEQHTWMSAEGVLPKGFKVPLP